MSTPHRATPEQWHQVEQVASIGSADCSCLLELRARIKALEATQHAHADARRLSDAEREQFYAELDVPQVLAHDWINRHGIFRTVSTGGPKERTGTDWGMVITEAARWGQRQGWFARAAAERPAVKESLTDPPANATPERDAAMAELRAASGEARPGAREIFPVEYADANGEGIRIIMEPADETGQVCWVVRNSRRVNPIREFPTPEAAYAAHLACPEQEADRG